MLTQTQGLQGVRDRVLAVAVGWSCGFHPQGQSIYGDASGGPETSGPTVWTLCSGSGAAEHPFPLSLTIIHNGGPAPGTVAATKRATPRLLVIGLNHQDASQLS